MSRTVEPSISVRVDPSNPGQFFACCGLLELADRLWKGAEGWFREKEFYCRALGGPEGGERTLGGLVRAVAEVSPRAVVPGDEYSSPIDMPAPFELRLDWWKDDRAGGDRLKAWAGSMRGFRIACAMQGMLSREELQTAALLDYAAVVYDPAEPDNKVEPFYFDARRGSNARPIDIGFSPDALKMESLAYPAVEFLCLVGIQRFRPLATDKPRVFNYYTWTVPLAARVAPLAACGVLTHADVRGFRFENAFRTDQRKHKAFTTATVVGREIHD